MYLHIQVQQSRADFFWGGGGALVAEAPPLQNFTMSKLGSCSTGAVAFYAHVWATKRWKRARRIANLIQELLRGAHNYSFGVGLTLEAAKIEIL